MSTQSAQVRACPMTIIDRNRSDADGWMLIRELGERYAPHPVVLMLFSSLDWHLDVCTGLDAGADAYPSKNASDEESMKELAGARSRVRLRSR
jgi:DNA-binding response OmpR family regulator